MCATQDLRHENCFAGVWAEELELLSDEQLIEILVGELQSIFPSIAIPPVSKMLRTKWRADKFSYGSYSTPRVGSDPLNPMFLAQPTGGTLLWAGEATSTLRHGYVDGAFQTGLREASRVLNLTRAPSFDKGSDKVWRSMRPENDKQLREEWWQLVQDYVL